MRMKRVDQTCVMAYLSTSLVGPIGHHSGDGLPLVVVAVDGDCLFEECVCGKDEERAGAATLVLTLFF